MKKLQLLSLVGITSIALAHAGWAAGHGGGGGGFHGGGGFGGGFHGGGFGGARGGGMARGGGFGGARFSGGARVSSFGPRSSFRQPVYLGSANRSVTASLRTTNGRAGRSVTPSSRATTASNRRPDRVGSAARPSRTFPPRGLNGRTDHIFARHDANWHRDWDRRHAHFFHGHFFVFDDGFWFGLDDGLFPWDYLPYYADDYYPYDYYADVQPAPVYNGAPVADAAVQAVQTRLTQLGYYSGPVDGIFGPATRDALAKYQIAKQLNVTGSLSPDTLQSLGLPQATSS